MPELSDLHFCSNMKPAKIYVLKLEDQCYYVGMTRRRNVAKRIEEHISGTGAAWTRKHKPLLDEAKNPTSCLIETIATEDTWDENKYVKKYMESKGIDNVRGGSYVHLNLSMGEKKFIANEIRRNNNACFLCGSHEHQKYECPKREKRELEYSIKSTSQQNHVLKKLASGEYDLREETLRRRAENREGRRNIKRQKLDNEDK